MNTNTTRKNARVITVGAFTNIYGPRGCGKTHKLEQLRRGTGAEHCLTTGELLTEYGVALAKRQPRTKTIFVDEATPANRKALAELVAAGFTVVAASAKPLRLSA